MGRLPSQQVHSCPFTHETAACPHEWDLNFLENTLCSEMQAGAFSGRCDQGFPHRLFSGGSRGFYLGPLLSVSWDHGAEHGWLRWVTEQVARPHKSTTCPKPRDTGELAFASFSFLTLQDLCMFTCLSIEVKFSLVSTFSQRTQEFTLPRVNFSWARERDRSSPCGQRQHPNERTQPGISLQPFPFFRNVNLPGPQNRLVFVPYFKK